MKRSRFLLGVGASALGAAFLGLSSPASADTVTLKNGRELHGRLIEERVDRIRIRTTGSGVIVIMKSDIATFSENEQDMELTPPSRTPAPEVGGETGGEPGAEGGDTSDGDWAPGVTDEQKAELGPLREKLEKELEELGPSAEERLKANELTAPERQALAAKIKSLAVRRRQGSANLRRRNAMESLVNEFGARAIPQLVDGLGNANQWIARMSAQALGQVARSAKDKAATQWLMFHYKAPAGLITLLDHQGEVDSPFIREEANASLEAISGASQGFVASKSSLQTPAEARAGKAWKEWWDRMRDFTATAEKKKETRRKELQDALAQIRQGVRPEIEPKDG